MLPRLAVTAIGRSPIPPAPATAPSAVKITVAGARMDTKARHSKNATARTIGRRKGWFSRANATTVSTHSISIPHRSDPSAAHIGRQRPVGQAPTGLIGFHQQSRLFPRIGPLKVAGAPFPPFRMNILSIQSHVAYGHVGNASAVFPMQRLGCEVWPIHTVQFSNHTGYGAWRGRVFDGPAIEEIVEGIAERGVLPSCDGVLSGYMGSADIGTAILSAVARVREANPAALYCCDPVIGDVGRGVFVRPGIPEFMRDHAVPAADIVTPNQFELDYLSGIATDTLASVKEAIAAVQLL